MWPVEIERDRNPRVDAAVQMVLHDGLDPKEAAAEAVCNLGTLYSRLKTMARKGEIEPTIFGPQAASRRQSSAAKARCGVEDEAPDWFLEEMAL